MRTYDKAVQDLIELASAKWLTGVARRIAQGELRYERGYPPVVNTAAEVEFARSVAAEVWGEENADANYTPSMGGEDFSYMLLERPGCYSGDWPGPGRAADRAAAQLAL